MALLEVADLRVGYGNPVLLGVSFDVEEGETAVLFGLNGAGKTTTVSTIAGLLKPDGGSISFDGEDIARPPADAARHRGVALVPEGRRVFPALSVANNLRLGAWSRRRTGRRSSSAASSCSSTSRAWPSGVDQPPARCRVASSRCCRSVGR